MNATKPFSPVVELRQYTLHSGMRETLVDLFDARFVESQEQLGIDVIGQFRDLDRPDRFVWLRGFADMESRRQSLASFYDGPVWAAHRDAANATMKEFDDVLLLRPAWQGSTFQLRGERPPAGIRTEAVEGSHGLTVDILHLSPEGESEAIERLRDRAVPRMVENGVNVLAVFVSEHAPNTFPRLPVREENVVACFSRTASHSPDRAEAELSDVLRTFMTRPAERLRLSPTSRSLLR